MRWWCDCCCSLYGGKLVIDEYYTDSASASKTHREILQALLCGTGRFGSQGKAAGSSSGPASASLTPASAAATGQLGVLVVGGFGGLPMCALWCFRSVPIHTESLCN